MFFLFFRDITFRRFFYLGRQKVLRMRTRLSSETPPRKTDLRKRTFWSSPRGSILSPFGPRWGLPGVTGQVTRCFVYTDLGAFWILARNLLSAIVLGSPLGVSASKSEGPLSVPFWQVAPSDLASLDPGGRLAVLEGAGR